VFTIAVNIVFLPMHFLGIAGMPRRIPDYADGYLNWNLIMTLGTFLTIISVVIVLRNLNRAGVVPYMGAWEH
jgi:cytochrome c oxidase subunit 1